MQKELASLKCRKINLADKNAPEITKWDQAKVGKFYRPLKEQITIRIDSDVLDWFKHAANKYQTLINQACREFMLLHNKSFKNVKRKPASME